MRAAEGVAGAWRGREIEAPGKVRARRPGSQERLREACLEKIPTAHMPRRSWDMRARGGLAYNRGGARSEGRQHVRDSPDASRRPHPSPASDVRSRGGARRRLARREPVPDRLLQRHVPLLPERRALLHRRGARTRGGDRRPRPEGGGPGLHRAGGGAPPGARGLQRDVLPAARLRPRRAGGAVPRGRRVERGEPLAPRPPRLDRRPRAPDRDPGRRPARPRGRTVQPNREVRPARAPRGR